MTEGISNVQIEEAFKIIRDEDIDNNFVVVFPSNYTKKCIDHAAMTSEKKGEYRFITPNTDCSRKGGTHWWSTLDIEPKTFLL